LEISFQAQEKRSNTSAVAENPFNKVKRGFFVTALGDQFEFGAFGNIQQKQIDDGSAVGKTITLANRYFRPYFPGQLAYLACNAQMKTGFCPDDNACAFHGTITSVRTRLIVGTLPAIYGISPPDLIEPFGLVL
jgi:hypothetical protein